MPVGNVNDDDHTRIKRRKCNVFNRVPADAVYRVGTDFTALLAKLAGNAWKAIRLREQRK